MNSARAEASRILMEAGGQAERARAESSAEAMRVRGEAEAAAQQLRAETEAKAQQARQEANDAARMRAEARSEADQVTGNAARILAEAEEQVAARLDQVAQAVEEIVAKGQSAQPRRHGDRRRPERGQLRRQRLELRRRPAPVRGHVGLDDGTTYAAPVTSGTTPNFVEGRGQTLLVPAGSRCTHPRHRVDAQRRRVDGAAPDLHGRQRPVRADLAHRLGGRQRPQRQPRSPSPWTTGSRVVPGVDGPPVQLFGTTVAADPPKQLQSVTLPGDDRFEVYAVSLR